MKKLTLLKTAIILFLIPFVVYIAYQILSHRKASLPASFTSGTEGKEVSRLERFEMKGLEADRESFSLNADKFMQLEKGLFKLEGIRSLILKTKDRGKIEVSADRGTMLEPDGKERRILAEGHVRLATEEGTVVETEKMSFEEKEQRIRADSKVLIRRGNILAGASAMIYDLNEKEVFLSPDFHLEIDSGDGKILAQSHSFRGKMGLGDGLMEGGVTISDPVSRVTAAEAHILSEAGGKQIRSIALSGDVRGKRMLEREDRRMESSFQAERMEVFFEENRARRIILEGKVSFQFHDAHEPLAPPRMMTADRLDIEIDARKDTRLEFTGHVSAKTDKEDLSCDRLQATLSAKSVLETAHAEGDVLYQTEELRSQSDEADYAKKESRIIMRERDGAVPRMTLDDWTIQAGRIEIESESRLKAFENIKSTYRGGKNSRDAMPLFDDAKTVFITSDLLFIEREREIHYSGNVRAWQEENSISADEIILPLKEESFQAQGKVVSRFKDLTSLTEEKEDTGLPDNRTSRSAVIQSDSLLYTPDDRRAVYRGNVVLLSAEREIKCQEMQLLFDAKEKVERILASSRVEMKGEEFNATGETLDYLTESQQAVMRGKAEPARVYDRQGREAVVGASLTFHMTDNKISLLSKDGGRSWITLK